MRTAAVAMVVTFALVFSISCGEGHLKDSRDGKSYRTVKMPDGKVWMAENLNYNASGSWCYDDDTNNCATYGRLYDWSTAMDVCPNGWHLPSDGEWGALATAVGVASGTKLKSRSGWASSGNGTDDYGFSALPGGNRNVIRNVGGLFQFVGIFGDWWSATEGDASRAYGRSLQYFSAVLERNYGYKEDGFSVRCLRD